MSIQTLTLGSVSGVQGKVVRGKYPLIELETGGLEELDVVIATGTKPGPKLLLTGNIHGNEVRLDMFAIVTTVSVCRIAHGAFKGFKESAKCR